MKRFRRECSLCGGRLENDICVECGLDNSKSDDKYVSLGHVHGDKDPMTHEHKSYDPLAGKTVTKEWAKRHRPQKAGKSKIILIIILCVIFGNLIMTVVGVIQNLVYQSIGEQEVWQENAWQEDMPIDPYAYVVEELSEEGLNYEVELGAGTYKGGVHIPEGSYEVSFIPEEDAENSYAELRMNDAYNGIYQSFYFGEGEAVSSISDFRVYTGGIVEIEGRGKLYFYSTNAQPQNIRYESNPNTQVYYLSDDVKVGEDILPGVYDVYWESGEGIFDYEVEHEEGYRMYCGKLLGDQDTGFAEVVRNVVLPDGVMVYLDGLEVKLVPSEKIESEDYQLFYNNY